MIRILFIATALVAATPGVAAEQPSCSHVDPWHVPPGQTPPFYDPFFIFFDIGSARITPQSANVLDNVADAYRPLAHCMVVVTAHTDTLGNAAANVGLSRRRARSVAAYLRRRGVTGEIRTLYFGETRPLVETGDGVAELQNRRAEIGIGPPWH